MDPKISPSDILKSQACKAEGYAFAVYSIYAKICKDAGYDEAALKLDTLANNEKEHLEQLLTQTNQLPDDALKAMQSVVEMEHHDATVMYTKMRDFALETGDEETAKFATHLIEIESRHEAVIGALRYFYETGKEIELPGMWVCSHCGNFYLKEEDIPNECPVCHHPKSDYIYMD